MTRPASEPGSVIPFFSLFASLGTLVCCALPSLLVLIGLGGSVASLLSAMPWLATLSRHKDLTFSVAGVLLAAAWAHRAMAAPRLRALDDGCSARAAGGCERAASVGRRLLRVSTALYAAGLFAAYALGPLLRSLEG